MSARRPRGSRRSWPLRCRAYDLGAAAGALPAESFVRADRLSWTYWTGGAYTLRPGQRVEDDLARLARGLERYSHVVVDKGAGAQIAMALVRDGARVEAACEALTGFALDSDVGLDPAPLLAVLDAVGAAYIWQSSSSSTIGWPKWHLIVPFATPIAPPIKLVWQAMFAHAIGVLEGAARMPGPRVLATPVASQSAGFLARHGRGLDPTTDGLVQMSFLPARRAPDRSAAEIRLHAGRALDLDAFLRATGYDPDLALRLEQECKSPPRERHDVAPRPVEDVRSASVDGSLPLLVRAFAAAGWLGDWQRGAWVARCPWWRSHRDATAQPSRSEWSARLYVDPQPTWWCPHHRCVGRRPSDVRRALPDDAWREARDARPARPVLRVASVEPLGAERGAAAADASPGLGRPAGDDAPATSITVDAHRSSRASATGRVAPGSGRPARRAP